ncbi:MAG TPA: response regulator [Roseiflexaceae bacterium]|nr:response regulator [Roseiflexaceae bacterium]
MARILVVEDNPDNRELLLQLLQRVGHEVLACGDGAEGIALAQQHIPDAVIMDLRMPKIDGWAAVQQLKADARTARIPVLAVTADALREAEQRARAVGCDAFLIKPFRLAALLTALDALLGRSSEVGGGS